MSWILGVGWVWVYCGSAWLSPVPTAAQEIAALALAGACVVRAAFAKGEITGQTRVAARAVQVAACLSALMALAQFIWPLGISGWIEPLAEPGRAFANLRQPNHLALLLALGLVATAYLRREDGCVKATGPSVSSSSSSSAMLLMVALLSGGMVLTGSRMALGFVFLIGLWALLDTGLSYTVRRALVCSPVVFVLVGAVLWLLDQHDLVRYYGGDRLDGMAKGEISASGHRATLWINTIELVKTSPWGGVGWGQFNVNYALGAYDRPALPVFTHAHNLPLQLAAELGVPAAALLMGALTAWAWWCRPVWTAQPGCYLAMGLVLVGVHSLLELPLWYAYFLLPTLAAMAALTAMRWRLYATHRLVGSRCVRDRLWRSGAFCVGLGMLGLAAALAWDYAKVVPAYSTAPTSKTLEERVARAQEAVFFQHAGLYARVITLPLDASLAAHLPLMQATARHYVDVGLMRRWAMALVFAGDVEAAEHLAWRLWRYDPDHVAELRAFAGAHTSNPSWQRFAAYLVNPTPVNLPLDRLLPAP